MQCQPCTGQSLVEIKNEKLIIQLFNSTEISKEGMLISAWFDLNIKNITPKMSTAQRGQYICFNLIKESIQLRKPAIGSQQIKH